MRRRGLPFIFFPPPPWLPSSPSRHVQPEQQAQRQKKTELSREDHVSSKVVAVMSTQEMDGVRSFGASNSFVEDLPQPVEGNMQDTPESVRNSVIEPRVGMEFDSLQQVIEFYKHYAYSKGFATMTRNSRKNKGFSETSYINLKCNREGRYSSLVDDPSKKRSTIKNACEAGIKASMDITDKKWRILSFIEEHNHDLSPSKSKHFAAFRHISTDTRRRLLINDNAGVRINSSIKASIVEAGGYENVTYNQRDVRNFLEKERRLKCKEGDGQALHDYFVRMQAKNSNFYHALDLDDELRVRNVFWVDARSRAAYESFNDVITFDTTYLTNNSTTLKVFVEQFENAMRNKVEKEILSDFESFKGKLECSSSSPMEKQFQEAYTHELFKRVRTEFSGRQGCIVNELVRGGDEVKYKIEDEACPGKLFEACLICAFPERVTVLPDRYEKLHRLAVGVLEIGAESVENFNVLEKLLIDLKDNFPRSCDKQPSSQRKNSVGAAPDVVRTEVVRSPMVVKRKGRPRMKRLKSSMEEAVGGSAYGDCSTSNMEYPVSMPHSNDGVIHLTNPMPSQSFVSESMSQTQAHGNEDQALNLP
uniref:Protein FAR1-RELATED SEQUENCE n=1 Tax=Fagus sylvatica TaxID=28930 RepID=A0A2N9HJ74_FAGSY